MLLHTLNKPEALAKCLKLVSPGDQVVLIEDGIYVAANEQMDELLKAGAEICALADDMDARGFSGRHSQSLKTISYAGLVQLAVKADRVCNWF